jgi:hypothetical protein
MPYKVEKSSGTRPWKIINTETKRIVGSSTTKHNAESSVRARYRAENK